MLPATVAVHAILLTTPGLVPSLSTSSGQELGCSHGEPDQGGAQVHTGAPPPPPPHGSVTLRHGGTWVHFTLDHSMRIEAHS